MTITWMNCNYLQLNYSCNWPISVCIRTYPHHLIAMHRCGRRYVL